MGRLLASACARVSCNWRVARPWPFLPRLVPGGSMGVTSNVECGIVLGKPGSFTRCRPRTQYPWSGGSGFAVLAQCALFVHKIADLISRFYRVGTGSVQPTLQGGSRFGWALIGRHHSECANLCSMFAALAPRTKEGLSRSCLDILRASDINMSYHHHANQLSLVKVSSFRFMSAPAMSR